MAELMMQFLLGYPSKHKMGPAKTILDKNKLICKKTIQPCRSRPHFDKTMLSVLYKDVQLNQLFYIPLFPFEVT
jgi:hypothetical protein